VEPKELLVVTVYRDRDPPPGTPPVPERMAAVAAMRLSFPLHALLALAADAHSKAAVAAVAAVGVIALTPAASPFLAVAVPGVAVLTALAAVAVLADILFIAPGGLRPVPATPGFPAVALGVAVAAAGEMPLAVAVAVAAVETPAMREIREIRGARLTPLPIRAHQ